MRRLTGPALAVLCVGALPPVARAQTYSDYWFSGNDLFESCSEPNNFAVGFTTAVASALGLLNWAMSEKGEFVFVRRQLCAPPDVQARQVKDIICRYLDAHPETRQEPAFRLSRQALVEAWPCPLK